MSSDPAVQHWKNQYRELATAELEQLAARWIATTPQHKAAHAVLVERRESLERIRFRLLLWVGIATLLATLVGVGLTVWQTFR